MDNPIRVLSLGLCPWLKDEFSTLVEAHRGGRLGHAWLLTGPWGVGKTNLALALAEHVLNPSGSVPQDLAAPAAAMARASLYEPMNHRPDLYCIFPQEQRRSIGIDQIREACQQVMLSSLQGVAKVVVVEPAEYLTTAAANALLKTLEEPTPGTYVWLVSHQPGRLPATIRSRCQRLTIQRPPAAAVLDWLEAGGYGRPAAQTTLLDRTPFQWLARETSENNIDINIIFDNLDKIIKEQLDPHAAADSWLKGDPMAALDVLAQILRQGLRGQLAPGLPNLITVFGASGLHTIEARLSSRQLFALLAQVEQLLASRGSGINEELALRVILLGFQGIVQQPRLM